MNSTNLKITILGAFTAIVLLNCFGNARAQGVTFNVGFESPTYSPGLIGGGNYPGQDDWYGFGSHFVANSQAHTGGQSLLTTSGGSVSKAFASNPLHGGYIYMDIGQGHDWYMQTWVYLLSGNGSDPATFASGSSLGAAFYVSLNGDGSVYFNSGAANQTQIIGSSLLTNGSA